MSWHVLYLRPRSEKKVEALCQIREIECYLPLRTETKIYQRRKVTVEMPMFPGYFFVNFEKEQRVSLLQTNHVISILAPDSEENLRCQLEQIRLALAVDSTLGAVASLTKGRRVLIKGGVFMGVEGVVEFVRDRALVRLNVDMIGQAVAVDVEQNFVELID